MFNDQEISPHNRRKQAHFLNLLAMLVNAPVKPGLARPPPVPRCPLKHRFSQCPLQNALLGQAGPDWAHSQTQPARPFSYRSNFPAVSIVAASLSNCTPQERPISFWGPVCFQGTGFWPSSGCGTCGLG